MFMRSFRCIATIAITCIGLAPASAEAGPLIDWLFGRPSPPAYAVGQPVPLGNGYGQAGYTAGYAPLGTSPMAPYTPGYAANLGNYYGAQLPVIGPNGAGYPAPTNTGITAATLPPTVSYVPNYGSSAYRAPVTYYRPLMTTDPNTGAQVVAMAPCTSYEYQTQRVPTFGRSALFGNYQAPVQAPAPQTLPTYTLPSGGIPLGYSVPSALQPTIRAYGNYSAPATYPAPNAYSALQPGLSVPPANTYPTAPLGSTPIGNVPYYNTTPTYNGSISGGSCGNAYSPSPSYVPPSYSAVPGLSAPAAGPSVPSTGLPSGPAYGVPSNPTPPSYAPGVYPPSDPADIQPSLPPTQTNLRPQLRSIVPQASTSSPSARTEQTVQQPLLSPSQDGRQVPTMSPIPVPKGFDQPNWNPGLLKEGDMTALRPVTRAASNPATPFAGQSKKIHWASFEESDSANNEPQYGGSSKLRQTYRPQAPEATHPELQLTAPPQPLNSGPVTLSTSQPPTSLPHRSQPAQARGRYDDSGWKSTR